MKLLTKVRKLVLPLAFVGVGVFAYFQANAAAAAPNLDCIDVATYHAEIMGWDVSEQPGFHNWTVSYIGCVLHQMMN